MINDATFRALESEVRSYCRSFPAVFSVAHGAHVADEDGRQFIDFLAGAGALNYGHNNPHIVQAVAKYIQEGGLLHSLDLHTVAKRNFLEKFHDIILRKRRLDYRRHRPDRARLRARRLGSRTRGVHQLSLSALLSRSRRPAAAVRWARLSRPPDGPRHVCAMVARESAVRAGTDQCANRDGVLGRTAGVHARSAPAARDARQPPLLRDGLRWPWRAHIDRVRIRDRGLDPRQPGECAVLERAQSAALALAAHRQARTTRGSSLSAAARCDGCAARRRSAHARQSASRDVGTRSGRNALSGKSNLWRKR